ncbi:MAG TPA: glycoside hydrolase family 5 protein [Anaerolineae bacterium]|nr:glycoside hydrolase family 5 protein [Anaerolineae bacterium]
MISIDGPWFQDEHGRRLILRGVNLGGSSKVPTRPDGATYRAEGFFDHRDVSFVGRPFPLDEADEHLRRLKRWGFTILRLLTTWEAIEHAGPGQYDLEYLDYLTAVVRKAGEHGLSLFIDPHQDVWSRFTGGDGAPGWTLEAAGFEIRNLHATGAAFLHQVHGDPLPRMIWSTNGQKLGAATMFTLFFGGSHFAPNLKVDGEPIQEYLQRHYITAIEQIALRLKGLPHVVGYDTLNEPSSGYIGKRDLTAPPGPLRYGVVPSPLESMRLGEGETLTLDRWKPSLIGMRRVGREVVNPDGLRAWVDGAACIWREHGVWDPAGADGARLLRPDHFSNFGGQAVDFIRDYYKPFALRFAERMQSAHPGAAIFLETSPGHGPPHWKPDDPANIVWAPHWYDGLTLFLKRLVPFLGIDFVEPRFTMGRGNVRRSFARQLDLYRQAAEQHLRSAPVIIGEIGIPFDMDEKRAYRTGDFRRQELALDRSMEALEANQLSATLWNYTPDNSNARGDQWNDEDLSIFSRDQQADPEDLDSGGRALDALLRPYPMAVAGDPLRMQYDRCKGVFEFEFRHDTQVMEPTIVYLPQRAFPHGCRVTVSDGEVTIDNTKQRLTYRHTASRRVHSLRLDRV